MKELTKAFQDSEVEIVAEKQQQKTVKLIDRQRKIRGHILWEYNQETGRLQHATFKKQDFKIESLNPSPSSLSISHKVDVRDKCIYFQALNRKNAVKKLRKIGITFIADAE